MLISEYGKREEGKKEHGWIEVMEIYEDSVDSVFKISRKWYRWQFFKIKSRER